MKKTAAVQCGLTLYSQMNKNMDEAIAEMNTARSQGAGFGNDAAAHKRATMLAARYIGTHAAYLEHNATHGLGYKDYVATTEFDGARRLKSRLEKASKQLKLHPLHLTWLKWIAKKFDNIAGCPGQKNYYTKLENALKALEVGPPKVQNTRVVKSYAATMVRTAKSTMKKGSNYSEKQEVSPDMVGLHLYDAVDYLKVAEYLHAGNVKRAANYVDLLDTAARDEVPQNVYQYLNRF